MNLLGTKEQAHRIALNVREQGRNKDEVKKRTIRKKKSNFYLFYPLAW